MKFTETHEWINIINDKEAIIGITNHAQELLGDIVYLELPKINDKISKNQSLGVIESVKAASDLYAPLSGTVIEVNHEVINNPKIINESPLSAGWLIKINIDNNNEINQLLSEEEYNKKVN